MHHFVSAGRWQTRTAPSACWPLSTPTQKRNNSTLSQHHSLTTSLSHNNTLSQHHSLTTTALSHNNSTFPYLTKSDQIGLFIRGKKYLDNSAICREGANQNIFIIHTHLILKITTYLDLPSFLKYFNMLFFGFTVCTTVREYVHF